MSREESIFNIIETEEIESEDSKKKQIAKFLALFLPYIIG